MTLVSREENTGQIVQTAHSVNTVVAYLDFCAWNAFTPAFCVNTCPSLGVGRFLMMLKIFPPSWDPFASNGCSPKTLRIRGNHAHEGQWNGKYSHATCLSHGQMVPDGENYGRVNPFTIDSVMDQVCSPPLPVDNHQIGWFDDVFSASPHVLWQWQELPCEAGSQNCSQSCKSSRRQKHRLH